MYTFSLQHVSHFHKIRKDTASILLDTLLYYYNHENFMSHRPSTTTLEQPARILLYNKEVLEKPTATNGLGLFACVISEYTAGSGRELEEQEDLGERLLGTCEFSAVYWEAESVAR